MRWQSASPEEAGRCPSVCLGGGRGWGRGHTLLAKLSRTVERLHGFCLIQRPVQMEGLTLPVLSLEM